MSGSSFMSEGAHFENGLMLHHFTQKKTKNSKTRVTRVKCSFECAGKDGLANKCVLASVLGT
eukprot:5863295-Amphidinium_carterae.1